MMEMAQIASETVLTKQIDKTEKKQGLLTFGARRDTHSEVRLLPAYMNTGKIWLHMLHESIVGKNY